MVISSIGSGCADPVATTLRTFLFSFIEGLLGLARHLWHHACASFREDREPETNDRNGCSICMRWAPRR
jgi:hypothetical protein